MMKKNNSSFSATSTVLLSLLLLLVFTTTKAGDDKCEAAGGFGYVCGPKSAEDMVQVPGTQWIIASGMEAGASITLIDSQQKTWEALYPGDRPRGEQNMDIYGACPGSPDPNNLITHGLNIRRGGNGHSTLYVVNHGGRESIEVFDVDANGTKPVLTWTGCVLTPEGMQINSVASFGDGSLVATIPLQHGNTITDAFAGEITGAVYQWSPGESTFEIIQGTELPYANGIEVSADDQEIYVVSSGLLNVIAYSRGNPARQLRATGTMALIPDNLHMDSEGRLVTAGMVVDDPVCGNVGGSEPFILEEFASCHRPFIVKVIDPGTMETRDLVTSPALDSFSNITMALQMGNDIWIGTFAGDRVAYHYLTSASD